MSMEDLQHAVASGSLDPWVKYLVVAFFSILGGSKALSVVSRTRTLVAEDSLATTGKHAQTDIIEQLQRRMTDLESEQRHLRSELEEERNRRTEAEDMVDALTRRVAALEAQIRALGHEPVKLK